MYSEKNFTYKVAKFIFETFVDIIDFNVTDLLGCTPLHIACYSGRLQIVKFILENAKIYGIDVDKKNNNGYNAEDIAKARERKEIVKLFVKSAQRSNRNQNVQKLNQRANFDITWSICG